MSKIINIEGNLLEQKLDIIGHQVNGLGIMGGGIALQIKKRYPNVYREYKTICSPIKPKKNLGVCQVVEKESGSNSYVANLFGQSNIGPGLQTDYKALEESLTKLKDYAQERDLSVGLPYMIGCGLAGGDWNIVRGIIENVFNNYPVTICRLIGK